MTESVHHQKLKIEAKQLLISKGYDESKILVDKKYVTIERAGQKFKFRIDVFASNGHQIAIECGNFPRWKVPFYEDYFGKEYVIHIPYPSDYGKTYLIDFEKGELDNKLAKEFLINSYSKYIYEQFKDDAVFDFQQFNEQNREVFDIDNHKTYRELNPDYGNKSEVLGRSVWMNFPDSNTLSKAEYKEKIHWGMIYYTRNKVGVTIMFGGTKSCEAFLDSSEKKQKEIFSALKILPTNFFIRDGFSFWKDHAVPPLDKEWNNPIPCHELTWEQYQGILENLENIIYLQKQGYKMGPVLDLAKVFCEDHELPTVIDEFRELYKTILKSHTKTDEMADQIKEMEQWEWYVSNPKDWIFFNNLFNKKKNQHIKSEDFKKACKLLRHDKSFQEWVKG